MHTNLLAHACTYYIDHIDQGRTAKVAKLRTSKLLTSAGAEEPPRSRSIVGPGIPNRCEQVSEYIGQQIYAFYQGPNCQLLAHGLKLYSWLRGAPRQRNFILFILEDWKVRMCMCVHVRACVCVCVCVCVCFTMHTKGTVVSINQHKISNRAAMNLITRSALTFINTQRTWQSLSSNWPHTTLYYIVIKARTCAARHGQCRQKRRHHRDLQPAHF